MSTHEWDMREALGAEGRAVDLFQTLEREVNRLRDQLGYERIDHEFELLARDSIIDAVTEERDRAIDLCAERTAQRDQAIDRCVALVAEHGTPGPVSLGGFSSDDIAGLA